MVDELYEDAKTSFPTRTLDIIAKEETKRTQKEQTYALYLRKGKNFYATFEEYIQKEYFDKGITSGFETLKDAASYECNVNKAEKKEGSSNKRR